MDFQDYIGRKIDDVKREFDKLGIKYKIVESSDIQKKYDTILVTKITKNDDYVLIVTDKFLLRI